MNEKKKDKFKRSLLTYLGLHSFHLVVPFSPFSLNHFQTRYFSRYFSSHLFSTPLYRYGILPFFSFLFFSFFSSHFSSFLFCLFFSDAKISLGGTFFHLTNSTVVSSTIQRQIKATIYIFDRS